MENNFETILKEQVDGYRIYPSNKTWPRIHNNLHGKQRLAVAGITTLLLLTILMFTTQQSFPTNDFAKNNTIDSNIHSYNTENIINEHVENKNVKLKDVVIENELKSNTISFTNNLNIKEKKTKTVDIKSLFTKGNNLSKTTIISTNNKAENKEEVTNVDDVQNEDVALLDNNELSKVAISLLKNENTNNVFPSLKLLHTYKEEKKITKDIKIAIQHKTKVRKQYYITPSISYRTLTDSRNIKSAFSTPNLDKSVFHKPAMGLEAGMNWVFVKDENLMIKTGFQLNYNRYNIRATNAAPEVTNITLFGGSSNLQTVSNLRNTSGFYPNWVENSNIQISLPIGFDYNIAGNEQVKLTIGSSLQPSYLLKNKMYLLSTDLKNYTKAPSLIRRFNINANVEALVTITSKKTTLQVGPQLRYQMLSTYTGKYPFKEKLFDYGFKIGISRPLF
jgi:hypothetical protein